MLNAPFQKYIRYTIAVIFICGENPSTREKSLICRKLLEMKASKPNAG
jgi:hypothetical protein